MIRTQGRNLFLWGFLALALGFYTLTSLLQAGPGVLIILLGGVLLLYGVLTTN